MSLVHDRGNPSLASYLDLFWYALQQRWLTIFNDDLNNPRSEVSIPSFHDCIKHVEGRISISIMLIQHKTENFWDIMYPKMEKPNRKLLGGTSSIEKLESWTANRVRDGYETGFECLTIRSICLPLCIVYNSCWRRLVKDSI